MNILANAIKFASEKHIKQTDKGGHPYILHPLRMMMRLNTQDEELMAIAVLHDVIEDCGVTYEELYAIGMTARVVHGVESLTKRPVESYAQFITRQDGNYDALRVKREDLIDNSDLTRLKGVGEKDIARAQRYMIAFKRVESMIAEYIAKPKVVELQNRTLYEDPYLLAANAWEVCASIHSEYARGHDAFFKTRQADFNNHAEQARARADV